METSLWQRSWLGSAGLLSNAEVRAASLQGLEPIGIRIDAARNTAASGTARFVSADDNPVAVLVVPTNEEWEIARQALGVVRG